MSESSRSAATKQITKWWNIAEYNIFWFLISLDAIIPILQCRVTGYKFAQLRDYRCAGRKDKKSILNNIAIVYKLIGVIYSYSRIRKYSQHGDVRET